MYGNVLTYIGIILSIGFRYISMGSNIICTEIGLYHIILFVVFSKILNKKQYIRVIINVLFDLQLGTSTLM